jgi:hypothetical protein
MVMVAASRGFLQTKSKSQCNVVDHESELSMLLHLQQLVYIIHEQISYGIGLRMTNAPFIHSPMLFMTSASYAAL